MLFAGTAVSAIILGHPAVRGLIWKFVVFTENSVDATEDDCKDDEPRVEGVFRAVDGRHAQKQEDDRFGRRRQHFHRVFCGRLRFGGHVLLRVILHRDSAKSDAKK